MLHNFDYNQYRTDSKQMQFSCKNKKRFNCPAKFGVILKILNIDFNILRCDTEWGLIVRTTRS